MLIKKPFFEILCTLKSLIRFSRENKIKSMHNCTYKICVSVIIAHMYRGVVALSSRHLVKTCRTACWASSGGICLMVATEWAARRATQDSCPPPSNLSNGSRQCAKLAARTFTQRRWCTNSSEDVSIEIYLDNSQFLAAKHWRFEETRPSKRLSSYSKFQQQFRYTLTTIWNSLDPNPLSF
jgi:hypothetical protein